MRIRNCNKGTLLADQGRWARSLLDKGLGLMFRKELPPGSALVLSGTRSIHTCFMRFPIDVVFLGPGLEVVRLYQSMPPWRFSAIVWRSRCVVELPAGVVAASGTELGDRLEFEE